MGEKTFFYVGTRPKKSLITEHPTFDHYSAVSVYECVIRPTQYCPWFLYYMGNA